MHVCEMDPYFRCMVVGPASDGFAENAGVGIELMDSFREKGTDTASGR